MQTLNNFPYHRQDNKILCGPACAQMVQNHLAMTHEKANYVLTNQLDLKKLADQKKDPTVPAWLNYKTVGWSTRPDELEVALVPTGSEFKVGFVARYVKAPGSFKALLDKGTINNGNSDFQACPIVPIHGPFYYKQQFDDAIDANGYSGIAKADSQSDYDAHWIVLFQYQNNGFIGNDPWFPVTKVASPHTSSGSCCKAVLIHVNGSGRDKDGKDTFGDINFPVTNRAAIFWMPAQSSAGLRIALPLPTDLLPSPPLPLIPDERPNKGFSDERLASQIRSFGLLSNPPCNSYLVGATMGKPRLVRRLDVVGRDYYLVPFLKSNGDSVAMMRVDAPRGEYLDSLYYTENPFLFDKSPARQTLVQTTIPQRLIALGKSDWLKHFAQQINEPSTEMVWLPCEQSVSAFFPFYVIKTPTGRFLVRVDGEVFSQLTY